jgi:hypothetical protein
MEMDPEKVLIQQKVERAVNPTDAGGAEYMLAGEAIGEEGLIQVALDAHNIDGTCHVTIADGHRTGESVTVSDRHITAFGKEFVEDAARRLFR